MIKKPNKIVLAPDSFKGSLSAKTICNIMEIILKDKFPDTQIISIPMADGGEGTIDSLKDFLKVESINLKVNSPIPNEKVEANYIFSASDKTAIIEMAEASGIKYIENKKSNPFYTTTYGTGELIKDALDKGCKKIILGIGGSATNDGGSGLLQALGVEFYDQNNNLIESYMTNQRIAQVKFISLENFHLKIKETEFIVLCDVTNPLLGDKGATKIFSKQKFKGNFTSKEIENFMDLMELNLEHFYNIAENIDCYKNTDFQPRTVRNEQGSGAAGGLGAASKLFLNGKLIRGIEEILKITNFEKNIQNADLIITGEGSINNQTIDGKTISGIINIAKKSNIPVIAVCGSIEKDTDLEKLKDYGLNEVFSICNNQMTIEDSMKNPQLSLQIRFKEIIDNFIS